MLTVYVDIDDTLADYTGAVKKALKQTPGIIFPQSQYGFYTKLSLIPDGLEAITAMSLRPKQFDVWLLTAPSIKNPLSYTEKRVWVENRLGEKWVDRLIISPNKGLLKGDILIDNEVRGRGQENFEGELIEFGSKKHPNWKFIRSYLNVQG